jgi:hypothetical protein
MHGDSIQLVGESAFRSGSTNAIYALAQCLCNRLGLGFSG